MTIIKTSVRIARIGILLIFLVTFSVALGACFLPVERILTISVHNQTNETLQIFHGGEVFIGKALPGGEVTYKTGDNYPQYTIAAKDMEGNVVYTANFTRRDVSGKKTYDPFDMGAYIL